MGEPTGGVEEGGPSGPLPSLLEKEANFTTRPIGSSTIPTKPNLSNQTYQTKLTKPNLPNQTYYTKITGQSSQRLGL